MNETVLDAHDEYENSAETVVAVTIVYIIYAAALLVVMYWVAHADVPILELPLRWIGFKLDAWIELPFLIVGIIGGLAMVFWRLGFSLKRKRWRLILGGSILGTATFVSHVLLYQTDMMAKMLYYILPVNTLWGIRRSDFYVTILFYILFIALIEIVMLFFKAYSNKSPN